MTARIGVPAGMLSATRPLVIPGRWAHLTAWPRQAHKRPETADAGRNGVDRHRTREPDKSLTTTPGNRCSSIDRTVVRGRQLARLLRGAGRLDGHAVDVGT